LDPGRVWDAPDVIGTFEDPPELQAAIASAAMSGATNFNDPFTKAPYFFKWVSQPGRS
jgi:hypothetical protein